jgi:hypothetical protein
VGLLTISALLVLVFASGGVLYQSRRAHRETSRLSLSIERLRLLRRALEGLHAEAAATRASADLTTDDFAQRSHR